MEEILKDILNELHLLRRLVAIQWEQEWALDEKDAFVVRLRRQYPHIRGFDNLKSRTPEFHRIEVKVDANKIAEILEETTNKLKALGGEGQWAEMGRK